MSRQQVLSDAHARVLSNSESLYRVACFVNKSDDAPSYLYGYFSSMHLCLSIDKFYDESELSRSNLVKKARAVAAASSAIAEMLEDVRFQYALTSGPYLPPNIADLQAHLNDVSKRVTYIASDKTLVADDGARRGSGTLRYPWPCSMKVWIAILIVAAMEHQHGELPRPRNLNACDAAEALWVSIGGNRSRREQARNSWRAHIEKASQDCWASDRDSIRWNIAFRKNILELRDAA